MIEKMQFFICNWNNSFIAIKSLDIKLYATGKCESFSDMANACVLPDKQIFSRNWRLAFLHEI